MSHSSDDCRHHGILETTASNPEFAGKGCVQEIRSLKIKLLCQIQALLASLLHA